MATEERYKTFKEFYPFYLSEHKNTMTRRLHVIGTSVALALLFAAFVLQSGWMLLVALLLGYAFAWVGHFFFEHNKPATFKYPLYSFMGDWRLWWEVVTGKRAF